ncbi:hypothetical protein [Perigonia lusca single nucleopolyhedrovirus]|uniref:Uncharacterized protein n=1 Tax=Perigonia lusca single nucleopolyhedrovirus TaxID=1675865 RepID=A0A0M3WP93_9ABAC|nr:hypothetical protein [Perigonia lusca single nucleopolyhedrovirus]AKN80632.1 hypothetical protein [Perigonia lusca single nucleopolyhedrovirus]
MSSKSSNIKFLEFKNILLDARHIEMNSNKICSSPPPPPPSPSSIDTDNDENDFDNLCEYIVFLNVKEAFFVNFNVVSDMSLETLTMHIYDNIKFKVDNVLQTRPPADFSKFIFNEYDNNKSITIVLHKDAKIIVAKCIRFYEKYHQRISGFMDFKNRHQPVNDDGNDKRLTADERAKVDREYEIKLLEMT